MEFLILESIMFWQDDRSELLKQKLTCKKLGVIFYNLEDKNLSQFPKYTYISKTGSNHLKTYGLSILQVLDQELSCHHMKKYKIVISFYQSIDLIINIMIMNHAIN